MHDFLYPQHPKVWSIDVDIPSTPPSLLLSGHGCRIVKSSNRHVVSFLISGLWKEFMILDNDFLSSVFSLSRSEKENFLLVSNWTEQLCSTLVSIPYVSVNAKSLKRRSSMLPKRIPKPYKLLQLFNLYSPSSNRIGLSSLSGTESDLLMSYKPKSNLLSQLFSIALHSFQDIPFIRLDYLLEACFYFKFLECEFNTQCIIDGGDK